MTQINTLKNTTYYLLSSLLGNFISMLALPIYASYLTTEEFGLFALSQSYSLILIGISNFGLTIGFERNFFENTNPTDRATLLYSTLVFVISTFIISIFTTFIFKDFLSKVILGTHNHSLILILTFCSVGMTSMKTHFLLYFRNTDNAKSYFIYSFDEIAVGISISLLLVTYFHFGLIGMILGPLISSFIFLILLFRKFLKIFPFKFDKELLHKCLKLSFPLTPRIIFGVVASQFDKILISRFASLSDAGLYSIAQRIVNIILMFMTALQNVISPIIFRYMFEVDKIVASKDIGKKVTPYFYVTIFFTLIISLFSEELFFLFMNARYMSVIEFLRISSLTSFFYFFGKLPQLSYAKKTGTISLLTLFSLVISIIICTPFAYYFGIQGILWGTFIASLISGSIYFIVAQRSYFIKFESKKIITTILFLYLSFVLFKYLTYDSYPKYLVFLMKLFVSILYLYIGYKIKIYDIGMIKKYFIKKTIN